MLVFAIRNIRQYSVFTRQYSIYKDIIKNTEFYVTNFEIYSLRCSKEILYLISIYIISHIQSLKCEIYSKLNDSFCNILSIRLFINLNYSLLWTAWNLVIYEIKSFNLFFTWQPEQIISFVIYIPNYSKKNILTETFWNSFFLSFHRT